MVDYINEIFIQFIHFSKSNPVVSGIVSIWGFGVVTFVFRQIPNQIWQILVKQFTVRVVINSKDEAFYNLIQWYEDKGYGNKARTLRLNNGSSGDSDKKKILSAGYGNHYFFFYKLPFRLTRSKEKVGNFYDVRESIEIVTIGRSQKPIRRLLEVSNSSLDSAKMTKVYKWDDGYWLFSHDQLARPLESISLQENIREKLIQHLTKFKADKNWYLMHGIPYRTGICLYGPPGTGKTSLVRAICGTENFWIVGT